MEQWRVIRELFNNLLTRKQTKKNNRARLTVPKDLQGIKP